MSVQKRYTTTPEKSIFYSIKSLMANPLAKENYEDITSRPLSTIHFGTDFRDGGAAGMGQYELNKW